ncbi:MAG: pseudouridine-5'-phosphate glycosidase [Chloroflexi bacterium]|jgi:pseudouridine-5'-phosphate glycosidase|nr:pseudouridine-5'-phosphate glycosidase [Chloroflexota bacterium]
MSPTASATGVAAFLHVSPPVRDALASGTPVVALESTLVTHGLPYPENLAVARAAEDAVRAEGAVPATVAIRSGRILVGLGHDELAELATVRGARKASRPTLAATLAAGAWAGTTVSATMIAAAAAGIGMFATGGIGGVHRGAFGGPAPTGTAGAAGAAGGRADAGPEPPTLDVSSDLAELARTPVAVVCAGPKAILDVPLTLEYLETHGVPVVVVGTDEMPGFYSRRSGIPAPASVPDEAAAAVLLATHRRLGLGSGVLLCVPVPAEDELPLEDARAAIARATIEADAAGVHGPALTPWLLARVAAITEGASVRANTALIVNDARMAARIAVALERHRSEDTQ